MAAADERDFRRLRYKSPETFDRKWYEWFHEEFARKVYSVEATPAPDVPLRIESTTRVLPELALHVGSYSAMRVRSTDEFIESGAIGFYVVLGGEASFRLGADAVDMTPGMAVVGGLNGSRRGPGIIDIRSQVTELAIGLSPPLMTALVPHIYDLGLVSIPTGSEALRLVLNYVRMLDAEETIDSPEARRLAALHVHDLVALALGVNGEAGHLAGRRGLRAGRLAAVKDDILAHLSDPGLSVSAVAARQALTPRYIHMLFEADGVTFSEYVLAQRLDRAWRMLIDPRHAGQPIGHIGFAAGFGDLSYFNRTFRRRYGGTPSDVRRAALAASP